MSSTESSSDEAIILYYMRRRRRRRRRPRSRVSQFLQLRQREDGIHETLRNVDHTPSLHRYENFHRLTSAQFQYLVAGIGPGIERSSLFRADVIPVEVRLSLTLRYLCSGMGMMSLHYMYKVSVTSVSRIIKETCGAIWDMLSPEYLKLPTEQEFSKIAEDFAKLRDFPNCVGCIDGKHVVVQSFKNTGSMFYNYKGTFSIVLMGVCDANYRFTYVSIGSAGRESDGRIFENCTFGRMLQEGTLPLPGFKILPRTNISAPHVFLGDNAFPLHQNLLCPYPGVSLHPTQTIFNYRHSRGRRMIENTFGIVTQRFAVFRGPIIADEETAVNVVKASVVLHNYLITADLALAPRLRRYLQPDLVDRNSDGNVISGSWRRKPAPQGMQDIPRANTLENLDQNAADIRDTFRQYFVCEGQVPFQWQKLPAHHRLFYDR